MRSWALALAVLLWGCAPRQAAEPDRPKIALVMKSLANEFFVTMEAGARADQARRPHRYRLLVNGIANESDLAHQAAIIDQMITSGAKAIVIAPADSRAIVPALVRAQRAGLVVVNIDSRLDPAVLAQYGAKIPFVGPDNKEGAYRVGRVVARQLAPGDQVAILEGIPTADNSIQRRDGLLAAAREARLDVVTIQSASWEQAKAASISSSILIRYPRLKAILCANDSMAFGAASAVKQAGRSEVKVSGFDNISAIRALILSGDVVATADQHGDDLAVFGIDYALDALAGHKMPADRETPVNVIDRQTIARSK